MAVVSLYGLGFQLLIIARMLSLNLIDYIIPLLIISILLIIALIEIRKTFFTT